MKDFLKYTFATVAGIFIFLIIMGVLGMMSLVGMLASSDSTTTVKENSVMVLQLDGVMSERSEDDLLGKMAGQVSSSIGLEDVLNAIKKAKENDAIKGIYIEAGLFAGDTPASMQALRKALVDFKKSGKWIVAYGDQYSQGNYYIASVADKVWMNPQGMVDWHGLASEPYFLKDLMAKFGVKMQLAKVGAYKSAPEVYTADQMSDNNREQVTAYVTGIWNNMLDEVSASRKINKDSLNAYADRLVMFETPENLLKYKMVDKLLYNDEVKVEVRKLLGLEEDESIPQLSLEQMKNVKEKKNKSEKIAVYYAYDDIVDQEESGIMSGDHSIVGNEVNRDLEKLMNDDDVKAVVLRVNSGGGSAYASEQIWHAVKKLKEKKPVVVSMGGMAASGGYYISCEADWIVAEPTTLTGSIGIFGMFPDVSQLLTQKLGVKFDVVKTNKNSNFGTTSRPFNEEEMSYLNMYIQRGYELFRKRVADGRKLPVDAVEKVAQGHVWLGQDALKIKLVDQLGGLDEAVKKAAELAKIDEFYTDPYPAKADFMESLMKTTGEAGDNYLNSQLRATLGEYYEPFMLMKKLDKQSAIQARVPYYFNIK